MMEVATKSAASANLDAWLAGEEAAPPDPGNPLDREESLALHRKLTEWLDAERIKQSANRYQMALDHDFYDGLQWSEEDILELKDRHQAALVYNMVKPTIDWVTGTEKRTRVDFKVLPREEEGEDEATVKTKVLKYLADVNRTGFSRSRAFADAVKGGVGWLEDGIRQDQNDEPIFSRYESWRNVLYDSLSVEPDMDDARYLFRWKWVDLDIALAMFPDRHDKVRAAAMAASRIGTEQDEDLWYLGQNSREYDDRGEQVGRRVFTSDLGTFQNRRQRVKLYECWYRKPALIRVVRGDQFDGEHYDPNHPQMRMAVENGFSSVYDAIQMQMRLAIFTDGDLLQEGISPYKHKRFPLTPIWCFRRNRDNAPYGIVRNIRDPQEDLNKRMSKAQFILASNQVVMEDGAVDDLDVLADEVARPNGIIVKKKGKEFEIKRDNQLAQQHIELAHFDTQKIQDAGGITDEQMGRSTNAQSGRAIEARQLQGSVVTAEPFDNLRMAIQLQGEIQLSLVEQYMPTPRQIRLVGTKGALDWVKINQPQLEPDGSVTFLNDITARAADFVVDQQDFHQTLRQAMFEEMMGLVTKLPPDVGLRLLDLVIEFSDVPNKDEIVARIRKITGEADPNAKLTPEEQQAIDSAQQAAQAAQAMQQQAVELGLKETEARINKLNAEAQELLAKAQSEGTGDQGGFQADIERIQREAGDAIVQAQQERDQARQEAAGKMADMHERHQAQLAGYDSGAYAAEQKAASDALVARIKKEEAIEVAKINAAADARAKEIEQASEAKIKAIEEKMNAAIDGLKKQIADADAAHKDATAKTKNEAASQPKSEPAPAVAPQITVPITFQSGAFQVDAGQVPADKTITINGPDGPQTATIKHQARKKKPPR